MLLCAMLICEGCKTRLDRKRITRVVRALETIAYEEHRMKYGLQQKVQDGHDRFKA